RDLRGRSSLAPEAHGGRGRPRPRGGRVLGTRRTRPTRARDQVLGRGRGGLLGPRGLGGDARTDTHLRLPLSAHPRGPRSAKGQTTRGRAPPQRKGVLASLSNPERDRKSTRLNSSHEWISYAVF